MTNYDVRDILEEWGSERQLSRRKLAFLNVVYEQFLESPAGSPMYLGEAEGLDLPACYEIQAVASLLDFVKPLYRLPNRLVEVTEMLVDVHKVLSREDAEVFYDEAL